MVVVTSLSGDLLCVDIIHEYNRVWTPRIGEILLLSEQQDNPHDCFAVAVMKDSTIVGRVPLSHSKIISFFLWKVGWLVGFGYIHTILTDLKT